MTEKYCDRRFLSVGTSVLPNVVCDERKSSDPDT